MKNFISVKDISDISLLVKEAMAYKADPFKDKLLGGNKRIGLLFLNPSMLRRTWGWKQLSLTWVRMDGCLSLKTKRS